MSVRAFPGFELQSIPNSSLPLSIFSAKAIVFLPALASLHCAVIVSICPMKTVYLVSGVNLVGAWGPPKKLILPILTAVLFPLLVSNVKRHPNRPECKSHTVFSEHTKMHISFISNLTIPCVYKTQDIVTGVASICQ